MVGQVMAYDGRDPAVLQAEGQGFESPKLHRTKSQVSDTALTWDLIFPELFKASVPVTCPMEFRSLTRRAAAAVPPWARPRHTREHLCRYEAYAADGLVGCINERRGVCGHRAFLRGQVMRSGKAEE